MNASRDAGGIARHARLLAHGPLYAALHLFVGCVVGDGRRARVDAIELGLGT